MTGAANSRIRPSPSYQANWQDLRRRQLLVWLIVLSYIPGVLLLSFMLDAWAFNWVRAVVPAGLWMAALGAAALYLRGFPCPRCRGPFFARSKSSRACLHCGLPRGALADRDDFRICD
jgi:hypothetical protein